jgi:hypothetical protein
MLWQDLFCTFTLTKKLKVMAIYGDDKHNENMECVSKRKFTIIETIPCIQKWTYEVEAANETEALEQVLNGKAEIAETVVNEHDYEEVQYEIEDAE